MSLYRTWRPATFFDLVGQDAVVRTLTTAIDTERMAHAYLFSGPRGSGKTSAAKILARCIQCVHGPTTTPCNTCENCTAILAGTAMDVLEVDAASNRGIDEIRALRDGVKFAPSAMRSKVFIIDEAHMLTKEGANAFLKTLEEPPPYAVFILATTAPDALPATVLSRCQRYAFRRIDIATMIARMRTIAAAEAIVIDDDALGAIAYRADGGLRDALTMLEQVAAYAGGPVSAQTVDAAFGQTGREYARRLLTSALEGDAAAALGAIDDACDAGTDMSGLIRGTISEFRHLLVARINPDLLARDLAADDAARALERGAGAPQGRIMRALRLLGEALTVARTSGDARLEIETAMLRFILQREDPSLEALGARVAALEAAAGTDASAATLERRPESTRSRPAADTQSEARSSSATSLDEPTAANFPSRRSAPTAASGAAHVPAGPPHEPSRVEPIGDLSLAKVQSLWQNVRNRAEGQRVTLRSPLSQTSVVAFTRNTITLRVADRMQSNILTTHMPILQAAVNGVFGQPLTLLIQIGNALPPPSLSRGNE